MKYLYTTEPDEGCHEIKGVYGRPVHTSEQSKLKAKGWKESPYDLRKDEEEGREEEGEVGSDFSKDAEELERYALEVEYKQRFGKNPHHKMKAETIRQKLENGMSQ